MKIEKNDEEVFFSSLDYGDVFKWCNGYYMKMVPSRANGALENAVALSTGKQLNFSDTVHVRAVNGKFVVFLEDLR